MRTEKQEQSKPTDGPEQSEPTDGQEDGQEQLEIPVWVRYILTTIGALLIFGASLSIILFVINQEFAAPEKIEAGLLLALGLALLLVVYVPWQRISLAGVEIERAVQQQTADFSKEIIRLEKELEKLGGPAASKDDKRVKAPVQEVTQESVTDDMLVLKLLRDWPTWGFTPLRIRNWGGQQQDYEKLGQLSTANIRGILTRLVAEDKVRTRVSSRGNLLYQAA